MPRPFLLILTLTAAALLQLPPALSRALAQSGPDATGTSAAGAPSAPGEARGTLPPTATLVYLTTAVFRLAGVPITMHAHTTTTWRLDGDRYETHLHMETADFDQTSHGTLGADGALIPDRYTEKRPFHNAESVDIDWPHGRIQFGSAPPVNAPEPGAQDRLSLQFEIARQCEQNPDRFVPGSIHSVKLIGTHDVDPWKFSVAKEEPVDTGSGPMRAVRFSARRMVGTVEETMDIWVGADLRWMPIRIRMVDRNQSIIDSVLEKADMP